MLCYSLLWKKLAEKYVRTEYYWWVIGAFTWCLLTKSSYYRGSNPQGSLLQKYRLVVFDTIFLFSLLRNGSLPACDGTFIAAVLDVDPIAVLKYEWLICSIPSRLWWSGAWWRQCSLTVKQETKRKSLGCSPQPPVLLSYPYFSWWFWGEHSCYCVNSGCSTRLLCLHSCSCVAEVSFRCFLLYQEVTAMCAQSTVRPADRKGSGEDYICRLETSKGVLEKSELQAKC